MTDGMLLHSVVVVVVVVMVVVVGCGCLLCVFVVLNVLFLS